MRIAAELAHTHELTLHDAAYAAVARRRHATLVSFDRALLRAELAVRPSRLATQLEP